MDYKEITSKLVFKFWLRFGTYIEKEINFEELNENEQDKYLDIIHKMHTSVFINGNNKIPRINIDNLFINIDDLSACDVVEIKRRIS